MTENTPTLDPESEARFDENFVKPRQFPDIQLWKDESYEFNGKNDGSTSQILNLKSHIAMEKELSRREGILEALNLIKKKKNPFNSGASDIAGAANNGYWQCLFDIARDIKALTPPQATPQKESHA